MYHEQNQAQPWTWEHEVAHQGRRTSEVRVLSLTMRGTRREQVSQHTSTSEEGLELHLVGIEKERQG